MVMSREGQLHEDEVLMYFGICLLCSKQLHKLNNYCTLMAVLSGLQHSSILRLKKTFDKLDKKTTKVSAIVATRRSGSGTFLWQPIDHLNCILLCLYSSFVLLVFF